MYTLNSRTRTLLCNTRATEKKNIFFEDSVINFSEFIRTSSNDTAKAKFDKNDNKLEGYLE